MKPSCARPAFRRAHDMMEICVAGPTLPRATHTGQPASLMPEGKEVNVRRSSHAPSATQPKLDSISSPATVLPSKLSLPSAMYRKTPCSKSARPRRAHFLSPSVSALIAVTGPRVSRPASARFACSPMSSHRADILSIDFDSCLDPSPACAVPHRVQARAREGHRQSALFITSDILLRLFDYSKYFETVCRSVQRESRTALPPNPAAATMAYSRHSAALRAR